MYQLKQNDIEQGLNEERDNLQPLLGEIETQHGYYRPTRPANLGLPGLSESSYGNQTWQLWPSGVSLHSETPSADSTANNTPMEQPDSTVKWHRSDRRLRRLNTELLEAIEGHDVEEVEKLLNSGANPNATCRQALISACHCAALTGGDALALLLKFGAEKHRLDRLGRTPLHLAAWAGNPRQMAILLDFPEDIQDQVDGEDLTSEAVERVKRLCGDNCGKTKELANVRCDLGEVKQLLPSTWKDNIDHDCRDITGSLPLLQPGWTPLHVASSCARIHCTRLLLAVGADPNICDVTGRTALDVAGSAIYYDQDVDSAKFTQVIQMLLKAGGTFNTMKVRGLNDLDTPLHTAIELENLDVINELLDNNASIGCLNAAGLTPLHLCVKKELEGPLQVLANSGKNDCDPLAAMVDVRDRQGHTVLQTAVEAAWVPGVCIALEAGADVTLKANDGETPIHSAAAMGNIDVLNEILSVAKQRDFIDCQNDNGETPLFKAIKNGHLECIKALLKERASIKIKLPSEVNVFHVATENNHYEILKELLEHDEDVTNALINCLTTGDKQGFGPIHFAVVNNSVECLELLLSKNADIRLRSTDSPHKASTPLHIAAMKNNIEVANYILKYDSTTIHEVNSFGWFPLHTAARHGSRDVITSLLRDGADLSGYSDGPKKFRRTAIDMIMNNLSKPTEYLEEVLDSYIATNSKNILDVECQFTVDYRILMPSVCDMEQMKVIQALINTGNRHNQKRLLVHPLVESFICLKWKALLPFFYAIIIAYALFVSSLTVFIITVFYYKDTGDVPPIQLDPNIWAFIVYGMVGLIIFQELLYMNIKSKSYFKQLETWVKFLSLILASIMPTIVLIPAFMEQEWPRHVATLAILLSWIELMFLLSRVPNWGYYVLMFGKVAANVVKILLTFAVLVIGFSLSFMIQFRSQIPFESPWAALVKTIVMMTSEFDYNSLFDEEHSKQLATSLVIIRIIFLIFLFLAAIVLMNLMVGVAVNDITDLELLGNIRRLAKQVEFLGTLDTLVYNKVFTIILPKRVNERIKRRRTVMGTLNICPGMRRWRKLLPSRLKDSICDTALRQKKEMDNEQGYQIFKSKINEMYEAIVKKDEHKPKLEIVDKNERQVKNKMRHEEIIKHLEEIDDGMTEIRNEMVNYVNDAKTPIEALNFKVDQMSKEVEAMKVILIRLENKLSNIKR